MVKIKNIDLNKLLLDIEESSLISIFSTKNLYLQKILCFVILLKLMKKNKIMFFSMGKDNAEIIRNMISIETGISINLIKEEILSEDQEERVRKAIIDIENSELKIETKSTITIENFVRLIHRYKEKYGIKIFFIENICAIIGYYEDSGLEKMQILKKLAEELEITMIVASQEPIIYKDGESWLNNLQRKWPGILEESDIIMHFFNDINENPQIKYNITISVIKNCYGKTGHIYFKGKNMKNLYMIKEIDEEDDIAEE